MLTTCPAHLILFEFVILVIFCEDGNYEGAYFVIFSILLLIFCLLGSNIVLHTLFSRNCVHLMYVVKGNGKFIPVL
jgi:hypothetical protein